MLGFAEEDDVVLVAFSGHGMYLDDRAYLCPSDADPDRPQTLLPLDEVYGRLKGCRANLRLLIVDACRNDPRPAGRKTKVYVAREFFTSQRPFLTGDLSTEVLSYPLARASLGEAGPRGRVSPRLASHGRTSLQEAGPHGAPPAGKKFTNSIGMKFRLIPAGEFLMGSEDCGMGVCLPGRHDHAFLLGRQ